MKLVFAHLLVDFLSTIVFLLAYAVTGDIYVATGLAIACGVAQFLHARLNARRLDVMTWASLALVIVLGAATLAAKDPRFVMLKPSIVHFALAGVMLRRGWMARYLPPIVSDNVPDRVIVGAGYGWAALMIALGLANLAIVATGDMWLWGWFVAVVAIGAKVVAFGVQYAVFRSIVRNRLRSAASQAA